MQVKYELNKKREDLPKVKVEEFDGIKLASETPDRPALPRHFNVCAACYDQEVEAARSGTPSRLPQAVAIHDLARCASLSAGPAGVV